MHAPIETALAQSADYMACSLQTARPPCNLQTARCSLQTARGFQIAWNIDTVEQHADATEESTAFIKAVQFTWQWRESNAFLAESFLPLKSVTRWQRFCFLSSELGNVRASQSTSLEDKCVTILKGTADINTMSTTLPPVLKPAGMSRIRADYLFKQIRPHSHEENRDVTCPDLRTAPEE